MDEEFIRNRITELRLKKGASEYQMSLALGQNRSYIQGISSGRSLPSMAQFLKICDYFEITPLQFFDAEAVNPQLIRKAMDGMRKLKDEDLIIHAVCFPNLILGKFLIRSGASSHITSPHSSKSGSCSSLLSIPGS